MIYKNEKCLSENKKLAFSLIEILMTLLIVSTLLVLMAPVITKNAVDKKSDGVVFTFDPNKLSEEDPICTQLDNNYASSPTFTYKSKKANCSKQIFTVPEGVNKINVTLVAGGGGGGGASGIEENHNTISGLINYGDDEDANVLFEKGFSKSASGGGQPEYCKKTSYSLNKIKKTTIDFLSNHGHTFNDLNENEKNSIIKAECDESGCNAGQGIKSSPAIVNFDIPNELFRKNYKEKLEKNSNGDELYEFKLCYKNDLDNKKKYYRFVVQESTYGKEDNFQYMITNQNFTSGENEYKSNDYVAACGIDYPWDDIVMYHPIYPTMDNFSTCHLKKENIIQPQEGQKALTWEYDVQLPKTPLISSGGQGGKIPGFERFGYGANGKDLIFSSNGGSSDLTLTVETAIKSWSAEPTPGPAYAQVTIHREHFSAPGGGGAPGGAIRILSLSVNPGEEYIIRVGKGGIGGNIGNASSSGSGMNGESGYSTSISKKNDDGSETPIIEVYGGMGGQGGQANANNDDTRGLSAKHYQGYKINTDYIDKVTYDNKLITTSDNNSKMGYDGHFSGEMKKIKYNSFEKNQDLMVALSVDKNDLDNVGGTNLAQHYSGNKPNTISVTFNGTSYANAYDGLFEKTIIDNAAAFVGENGGFNGLSMKAGCGGLFMGNFDGRYGTNQNEPKLMNKFIVNGNIYNVSDYYDNCTMETPDGQSANFVMPNPINKTYGQAGAGGGGGGYSLLKGPGKGGDGQNGYVMIDWKK